MRGYSKVSINEPPSGTITEEEALRDKGLKVHIGLVGKGGLRRFSVEKLSSQSFYTTKNLFLILLVATIVLGGISGLFLKFYGPWRVNSYLNYPSTNCTILNYTMNTGSKGGVYYSVLIEYIDSQNKTHYHSLSLDASEFISRKMTLGSEFDCVYKGSFVLDKQSLEDNLSYVKSYWYLGMAVNGGSIFVLGGLMMFFTWLSKRQGINHFYGGSITYRDDENLVINDWASIPSTLYEHFYVLLCSYYSGVAPLSREINFQRPPQSNASRAAVVKNFVRFTFFTMCLGSVGFAGYMLYGYNSSMYLFAEFMVLYGIVFAAMGVFLMGRLPISTFSIHTSDLFINYNVKDNQISGTLRAKSG